MIPILEGQKKQLFVWGIIGVIIGFIGGSPMCMILAGVLLAAVLLRKQNEEFVQKYAIPAVEICKTPAILLTICIAASFAVILLLGGAGLGVANVGFGSSGGEGLANVGMGLTGIGLVLSAILSLGGRIASAILIIYNIYVKCIKK